MTPNPLDLVNNGRWRWRALGSRDGLLAGAALLLFAILWISVSLLAAIELSSAEKAALVSSNEIAQTYQSQIARAFGEIDQTLNLVKYAREQKDTGSTLADLDARGLLPPKMLFSIAIVDRDNQIVEGQRNDGRAPLTPHEFNILRSSGKLTGSLAEKIEGRDWMMLFGRAFSGESGEFSGAVVLTVDAAYFVSAYEPSKLGRLGVLGLIGADDRFRIKRIGDQLSSGEPVDFQKLMASFSRDDAESLLLTNDWDGRPRYTAARRLYDLPLAAVVGLSQDEQLASARAHVQAYIACGLVGSAFLIVVTIVLLRMSRQLAAARQQEIDSARQHSERIEYLAYHDGLTALPNRSLFSRLLEQSIGQANRHARQLAILFLDLDRFKQVNDTLGHEAGDELLRGVAERLKSCVRVSDTVARLGGDEFVVLLPEIAGPGDVAAIAEKILTVTAMPFNLMGHEISVTTSIGISIYPQDGLDEQTLKKNADVAMYQSKDEGKNNFQFYSDKANSNSLQRLSLEASLRFALERDEFRVVYQAKKDLASGQITGLEALLRWQHPALGLMSPLQFLPAAEEMGLTTLIGRWVLQTVCRQNVLWKSQGICSVPVSVNLTARQFNDENLVADIAAILDATAMDADLLELEVKEGLLMQDIAKSVRILNSFKRLGIRIAIDDFGLSYVSLSAMQQFPIDTLKIDRSFMRDIGTGGKNQALTAAIIAMGKTLSLTVVAQGVENKSQADMLQAQSCNEFAGYFFHQPMPAEQCAELLRAQQAADAAA